MPAGQSRRIPAQYDHRLTYSPFIVTVAASRLDPETLKLHKERHCLTRSSRAGLARSTQCMQKQAVEASEGRVTHASQTAPALEGFSEGSGVLKASVFNIV